MTIWGATSALWLGILATASPCPLASNLAALSYLTQATKGRPVLRRSLCYALGRMGTHAILGWILLAGFSWTPQVRVFIQAGSARFVGPILLILGILLLGWLRSGAPVCSIDMPGSLRDRLRKRIPPSDVGALALGVLLSLLPCPEAAALFFGGLLPLALAEGSPVALPALFGLGAALPVGGLGLALAAGTLALWNRLPEAELWIRRISGGGFLIVGFYVTLVYTYGF